MEIVFLLLGGNRQSPVLSKDQTEKNSIYFSISKRNSVTRHNARTVIFQNRHQMAKQIVRTVINPAAVSQQSFRLNISFGLILYNIELKRNSADTSLPVTMIKSFLHLYRDLMLLNYRRNWVKWTLVSVLTCNWQTPNISQC